MTEPSLYYIGQVLPPDPQSVLPDRALTAPMSDWWVAVSNVRGERRATQGLEDRGFEVWWPVRVVEHQNRYTKKLRAIEYPQFPGYLFVRGRGQPWYDMIGVDGLKAVLCNDWKPVLVTDERLDRLRVFLASDPFAVVEDAYRIGDQVFITDGPFASFPAIIQKLVGSNRLIVEVNLFGRASPAHLDRGQVRCA